MVRENGKFLIRVACNEEILNALSIALLVIKKFAALLRGSHVVAIPGGLRSWGKNETQKKLTIIVFKDYV